MDRTGVHQRLCRDHTAEARATDKSGYTQTGQTARLLPNGASGRPSVG